MAAEIIDLDDWLTQTPAGQYALAWQQQQFDEAVADVFGFHALQIGAPCIKGLRNNRMPHTWVADLSPQPRDNIINVVAAPEALPFQADQLDLILMPHTLEACHQPHAALRDATRVLRPEGRLIISGFNPARFCGVRPSRKQLNWGESIGYLRLRDWLHLLGYEVDEVRSGCYIPGFHRARWIERLGWIDRLADQRVNFLGGIYFIVATKHIQGMRIVEPDWRRKRLRPQRAAVTSRTHRHPHAMAWLSAAMGDRTGRYG